MKLPSNLGPQLASLTREDGTVSKAYGGLRYIAGAKVAYFSLMWSEEPVEGPARFGSARLSGLDDFPEFDDVAVLTGSDETGKPAGVETHGWKLLVIEQTNPPANFKAETAGALFRVSPAEVEKLRTDIFAVMGEARDAAGDNVVADDLTAAGQAFYAAWIDAQRDRWQAEADSAVQAHDLIEYGDERP